MIKFVKKSKLNYVNGVLVDNKGRVVSIDDRIVHQLNLLENKIQERDYLNAQPKAQPMPSLDGFKRESIHDLDGKLLFHETPTIDKRIDEGLAFAREANELYMVDKANKVLEDEFCALIEFAKADKVMVDYDANIVIEIDTPELGDPLKLTVRDIVEAVVYGLGIDASVYERDEEE